MTYRDRITRWIVVRLLPNMQRVTIARFAKASDADGYAQALRRLAPNQQFIVLFDPGNQFEDEAQQT
ncbi:MAG: hypothetical protein B0A82_18025 [Alkalinema sp. CACIAM 70d]|nr:MAG: hypothetical protein B0A82_18025 [Alkalinema sp. CACIAM 70d]